MDSLPALVNDLLPRVFSCLCAEQDLGYIGMCDPKQRVGGFHRFGNEIGIYFGYFGLILNIGYAVCTAVLNLVCLSGSVYWVKLLFQHYQ